MNKIFKRIIKRSFVDRRLINPICKHYQLNIMRQQMQQPIIFDSDLFTIFNTNKKLFQDEPKVPILKPVITPNGVRTKKLVIPRPPENEYNFFNKLEMESVRKMNERFANRPKIPIKKPIMTPNGIRTEKLVISGPSSNEFNCF